MADIGQLWQLLKGAASNEASKYGNSPRLADLLMRDRSTQGIRDYAGNVQQRGATLAGLLQGREPTDAQKALFSGLDPTTDEGAMNFALTFAGPMAKTANLAKLKVAKQMKVVDNAGMNIDEMQKTYLESLTKDPYAVYGVRVIPHGHEVKVGDSLEHSKAWVDGNMTDEILPGVSTVGIEKGDVSKAIERLKNAGYSGKQIAIVKGDSGGYGDDEYERLIKNPEVVGAFLR